MQWRSFSVTRCLLRAGVLLLAAFTLSSSPSHGQDVNATLSGTVTDPSGAAIPNANLTITSQSTGFKTTQATDSAGEYNFSNLPPGKYDLNVSATNFKSVVENGIQLQISQQGRINVKLALGNTTQTVTVTGNAAPINFSTPQLGGGIAPEVLQDFPLIISGAPRSSVTVALMLPGVTTGATGNAYNARINGGLVSGDEAVVDGATAMEGFMNQSGMVSLETDFGMSPDITSEVSVLTANYGAQYGNTTSGQLIVQTRSGGEHFHGAAYEYLSNTDLNARQYGTPLTTRKPENNQNDFGAEIGGPIYLPGVHGPNSFFKGYFYFNWESFHEVGGANSSTLTIPSLNDRAGNFSGAGTQLYYPDDPTKYGASAGTAIAYLGVPNMINPAYEDPIAKAWMAELPTPTNSSEVNNYFIPKAGQGSLTNEENVYFARVDFTVGSMDHLYYTTWFQYTGVNTETNLPVPVSTATPADPENANIERLNWEHNFSGTITNHATLGYLNRNEGYFSLNGKSALPTVPGVADTTYLPEFTFNNGGYTQLGSSDPPNSEADKTTRGTWAFNDVFTAVKGSHTLNFGAEWRLAGTSIHEADNQGGTFSFSANTTGNQGCANSGCPGDAAASFYLGAAASGNVEYYNVHAEYPRQPAWAFHAGDNWRVNPKLTMDYSLRWDYISPFYEKYNNLSFIDPNGPNPGAVTSAGTDLPGRLAFAGTKFGAASYGARYPEIPFHDGYSPRVGLAYAVNPKTVIRAGYGIYFGQAFYPGWSGGMAQDGFNKNFTLNQSSSGNFQVPALYLTTGISPGQVGPTENISSSFDNGQTPSLYRPLDGNRRPYSSQWNLTVQDELPHNYVLTLSYVGTKGTHLPSVLNPINVLNPYNPSISGLGSDLSVNYNSPGGPATFAKDGVSVPYAAWVTQMTGCAPTIGQALLPYPQYCGTLPGLNEGHANSIYQSFQGQIEHRLNNGLYLLGTMTLAKLYTDSTYSTQSGSGDSGTGNAGSFSPYNETRARALAPDNVPITAQVSMVYDLPFGQYKQFLSTGGPLNILVGGWQLSPLFRYEYGTPLWFTSSSCPTSSLVPQFRESCVPGLVSGQLPLLHGRDGFNPYKDSGQYLNPRAFETNFAAFGYTGYGNAVSTVYTPSYQDLDLALSKNTKIGSRANFKLTANFFNALNLHSFVSPGEGPTLPFVTDVNASGNSFGTWNGTVTNARVIQVAGRLEF